MRAATVLAGALLLVLVALKVAPGPLQDSRNGEGIAWAAPAGQPIRFAEAGVAVTTADFGSTLIGRDIGTGRQRWTVTLPRTGVRSSEIDRFQRVGDTLLVTHNGAVHALDLATGERRWDVAPAEFAQAVIASPDSVALTRCDRTQTAETCRVESRRLDDGTVRWTAPLRTGSGDFLGSPLAQQAFFAEARLWPAGYALVLGRDGQRFTVRALDSGAVATTGTLRDGAVALAGDRLLRAEEDALVVTDLATGKRLWRVPGTVARSTSLGSWVGLPDGGALLASGALPSLPLASPLRVLDVRTGAVATTLLRVDGTAVTVAATDGPPVTAATATDGPAPGHLVLRDLEADVVQDGDRRYAGAGDPSVTTTQVGWPTAVDGPLLDGDRPGAEVHDRASGRRVVRYAGDGEDVDVLSIGDRIVIRDGDRDRLVRPTG